MPVTVYSVKLVRLSFWLLSLSTVLLKFTNVITTVCLFLIAIYHSILELCLFPRVFGFFPHLGPIFAKAAVCVMIQQS